MRRKLIAALLVLLAPSLGWGAGFALFEHGNRGMAMAGAMTAVADDPAALFWNPAGIAFQTDEGVQFMGGVTFILTAQDFTGEDPYPGAGYLTSQKGGLFWPFHAYLVYPLNDTTSFGLSVLSPFGLGTEWDRDHRGRFISRRASLQAFDVSPNLAFALTDSLAVGIGVDYRMMTIDLYRAIALVDPFTQQVVEVGEVYLHSDGLGNDGWGWHAGVLARLGAGFSFGALYRSKIDVDVEGVAEFTQYSTGNPMLDGLIATELPFDRDPDVVSAIEYPEYWSLGLAWSNEKWTFSGQYGRMGWDTFQSLDIQFPEDPELNESLPQLYEDVDQVRFGVEYRSNETWAFQFGWLYDNTPQPPEVMTPLLGDGDRVGYSFGVSWRGRKTWLDFGYLYLPLKERSTGGASLNGYDGTYEGDAHIGGATVGYRF